MLVQLSILPLPKANNMPLKAAMSLRREKIPQESNSERSNLAPALVCHFEGMSLFSADSRWNPWKDSGHPRQKLVCRNTFLCVWVAPYRPAHHHPRELSFLTTFA